MFTVVHPRDGLDFAIERRPQPDTRPETTTHEKMAAKPGRFSVNMCLYWLDVILRDGKWFPPPVERAS